MNIVSEENRDDSLMFVRLIDRLIDRYRCWHVYKNMNMIISNVRRKWPISTRVSTNFKWVTRVSAHGFDSSTLFRSRAKWKSPIWRAAAIPIKWWNNSPAIVNRLGCRTNCWKTIPLLLLLNKCRWSSPSPPVPLDERSSRKKKRQSFHHSLLRRQSERKKKKEKILSLLSTCAKTSPLSTMIIFSHAYTKDK